MSDMSSEVQLRQDLVRELAGLYRLQSPDLDEEQVDIDQRNYWLAWTISREILEREGERLQQVVEEMERDLSFTVPGDMAAIWTYEDVVADIFTHDTIPMPAWEGCVRLASFYALSPSEIYSKVANRVLGEYLARERDKATHWALTAPSPMGDEARASAINILLRGAASSPNPLQPDTEELLTRLAAALRKAEAEGHQGLIHALICEMLIPKEE